jgi:hypothetical protein
MINLELTDAGARIWVDEYATMQQKRVSAFFVRTGPAVKEKSKSGEEGPPTGPKDDAFVNCVEAEADQSRAAITIGALAAYGDRHVEAPSTTPFPPLSHKVLYFQAHVLLAVVPCYLF